MKRLIKEIEQGIKLYTNDKTGIAFIDDGRTGNRHACHPNIGVSGSVLGMKKSGYWNKDDIIIKSNGYHYNISKYSVCNELDKIASEYCKCEMCKQHKNIG